MATPVRRGDRHLAARVVAAFAVALCVSLATPSRATDVQVVGVTPGVSAEVVIDGGAPITLEVGGAPVEGVALLEASRRGAVVRVDGIEQAVPLIAPGAASGSAPRSDSVTLSADPQGHFLTDGTVNGRSVRFLVDTGATLVAFSRPEADRLGLDYRRGVPVKSATAGGVVNGWRVSLDSVAVGDTTARGVAAVVLDADAPREVLLGMSFLGRFDMQKRGSTLVLRPR